MLKLFFIRLYFILPLSLLALTNPKLFASTSSPIHTYGIFGDGGVWNNNTLGIQDSMKSEGITQLVMPGDNIYNPAWTYDQIWKNWSTPQGSHPGFSFNIVALGNHFRGSYAEEVQYFEMPGEFYTSTPLPNLRWIVLNSDNQKNISTQIHFLESTLESAQEENIILMYHHPTYTVSPFHRWTERKAFQLAVRPILERFKNKITFILNGHDHIASILQFNTIPVIVSGASHEMREPMWQDEIQDGTRIKTIWQYGANRPLLPHWVKLKIFQENKIQAEFFRVQPRRNAIPTQSTLICSIELRNSNDPQVLEGCEIP